MSVHLVLCHPLEDSLNAHLAAKTADFVRARGLTLDTLDLYASGFEPALTPEERRAYYEPIRPQNSPADLQRRLAEAEHLVLVFPTWWFAPPAMLKLVRARLVPRHCLLPGHAAPAAPHQSQIDPRGHDARLAVLVRHFHRPPAG